MDAGKRRKAGKGSCPCSSCRFDLKYDALNRVNTGGKKRHTAPNIPVNTAGTVVSDELESLLNSIKR